MAHSTQLGFQDAASSVMEELLLFHDHAMLTITLICMLVLYILVALLTPKLSNISTIDAHGLELIWTLFPLLILIAIAFPSIRILYALDVSPNPDLTTKVTGHQWYWSYEYSDLTPNYLDSYMTATTDLQKAQSRLLEVDNRMIVPTDTAIRTMITADDVLHSWAIPSLAVKTDAVPGQLSQILFSIPRPGIYYGQCSEICGANHSFMPIVMEALPITNFLDWSSQDT
uniref:Cytochrome c oxidase subunit 2 n=1 Tax=Platypelis tuberifera TaxID=294374 RepID=A0A343VT95_9NEOB|nr:cytochrome c oxidase subunit II [Platypelis tuberifera]